MPATTIEVAPAARNTFRLELPASSVTTLVLER
jgi:O-glycosyl hydrolase